MFQSGVIKLCINQETGDISELEKKVAMLEQKLNQINQLSVTAQNRQPVRQSASRPIEKKAISKTIVSTGKASEDWKAILEHLKKSGKIRLYTCLMTSSLNKLNDQTWEIGFPNGLTKFNREFLEDVNNKNDLIKTIAILTGNEVNIKLKDGKVDLATNSDNTSSFEGLGIDINIID